MTQEERRIYLIQYLVEEMPQYKYIKIPNDDMEQKQFLRSLMNVRPPIPITAEFLEIQDAYLSEEIKQRGIIRSNTFSPVKKNNRIFLWQGDITCLEVDAIVNAANSALLGCFEPCHSCIDNIIHSFSGVQLRLICNQIMQEQEHKEPTGMAKITPGYNLPCKYVLHTVGPIISGSLEKRDCELLTSCYLSCLTLAAKNHVESVAFCCISTGVFHFPQDKAAKIAVDTVSHFLEQDDSLKQVIFNVFADKDRTLYQNLLEV